MEGLFTKTRCLRQSPGKRMSFGAGTRSLRGLCRLTLGLRLFRLSLCFFFKTKLPQARRLVFAKRALGCEDLFDYGIGRTVLSGRRPLVGFKQAILGIRRHTGLPRLRIGMRR